MVVELLPFWFGIARAVVEVPEGEDDEPARVRAETVLFGLLLRTVGLKVTVRVGRTGCGAAAGALPLVSVGSSGLVSVAVDMAGEREFDFKRGIESPPDDGWVPDGHRGRRATAWVLGGGAAKAKFCNDVGNFWGAEVVARSCSFNRLPNLAAAHVVLHVLQQRNRMSMKCNQGLLFKDQDCLPRNSHWHCVRLISA